MTVSIWLDNPTEKKKEEVDVAIVGGGIAGAAAAYWVSRRGGLKCALIDANQLAAGASGRNAGFVLRGIQAYYNRVVKDYGRETAKFLFAFGEESQQYLKEFCDKHGNSFDYDGCGSYLLACSLEELENLRESAELMKEDGFQVEYLTQDPIDRDFYGAIFNPGDVGVHPAKLVRALAKASGATIHEQEPLNELESEDHSILINTPKRTIRCRKLLLATNAYTSFVEPWFADRVRPARGQILVTQPLRKKILERLCYANYGWEYFRQLPDNRLLLGGCREQHFDEEVGYADIVTRPVQTALEHYLKDRFPDVAGVPIDYRFAGVMGFTSDGLPMVGQLKSIPGAYFAVACNGHGLGYSLALSRLLVDVAMEDKGPGVFDAYRASLEPKVAPQDKGP